MGGGGSAPKQVPLGEQYQSLISAISNNLGNIQGADQYLDPQLSSLYTSIYKSNAGSLGKTLSGPAFSGASGFENNAQQGALNNLENFGSNTVDAFLTANPALSKGLGQAENYAINGVPGVSGLLGIGNKLSGASNNPANILGMLNATAKTQLNAGAGLTASEMNDVGQSTAELFAGNGMLNSSAAAAAAGVNTAEFGQNLLNQRETTAGNVSGLNTSADQVAAGAFNLAATQQNQAQTNLFGYAQTLDNPLSQLQQSYLSGVNNLGSGLLQASMGVPMTSQQISPLTTSQMQNFFDTGYNAQVSQNIANQQSQASETGSMIGLGTSMATTAAIVGVTAAS